MNTGQQQTTLLVSSRPSAGFSHIQHASDDPTPGSSPGASVPTHSIPTSPGHNTGMDLTPGRIPTGAISSSQSFHQSGSPSASSQQSIQQNLDLISNSSASSQGPRPSYQLPATIPYSPQKPQATPSNSGAPQSLSQPVSFYSAQQHGGSTSQPALPGVAPMPGAAPVGGSSVPHRPTPNHSTTLPSFTSHLGSSQSQSQPIQTVNQGLPAFAHSTSTPTSLPQQTGTLAGVNTQMQQQSHPVPHHASTMPPPAQANPTGYNSIGGQTGNYQPTQYVSCGYKIQFAI